MWATAAKINAQDLVNDLSTELTVVAGCLCKNCEVRCDEVREALTKCFEIVEDLQRAVKV